MIRVFFLSLSLSLSLLPSAQVLHVGNGHPYATLSDALADVEPGDLVLVHEGTYSGGLFFENIQGTPENWIFIQAVEGEVVIFSGGNNAWQFTDAAYLHISGFIFEQQTGNGLNFDDGGSYETQAHHLIFEACIFQDIDASGNNDLLKMSGIDDFEIRDCLFLNGAEGGSGIDMVGCHDGLITGCLFENMGSNGIQAKGGTRNVHIERNFFKNAGQRSLNLGGSTGLQFFRPLDAEYEAADLKVYANVFIGSTAPIAFVGCINTEVINNTIYLPDNWVLRILQETVDTTRFFPCGNNAFINNLMFIDNNVNVVCNIGPNTAPETFTFSNNLWFHAEQPGWSGPVLPLPDINNIVGEDPLFGNVEEEDFTVMIGSPAIENGVNVAQPELDFTQLPFHSPRSIGAFEGFVISSTQSALTSGSMIVYPNPVDESIIVKFDSLMSETIELKLLSFDGKEMMHSMHATRSSDTHRLPVSDLPSGIYLLVISDGKGKQISRTIAIVH